LGEKMDVMVESSPYLLHQFLSQSRWVVYSRNSFSIYRTGNAVAEAPVSGQKVKVDAFHTLVAAQLIYVKEKGTRVLILDWELQPGRKQFLTSELYIADEQEMTRLR